METPQDHDGQLLAAGGSPAALIRNKALILEEFRAKQKERLPSASAESGPIIINTLPAFITRLALALAPGNEISFASEYSNLALAHGNERAKMTGYSLGEVIHEYQILREILMRTFRSETRLAPEEWDIVHRSIDEAMAEAATAYVQVQQRFRDLFTAALTHDFRGPLSNAMNYIDLIRRDAEPGQHGHFASRALYNLKRIDRRDQFGLLADTTPRSKLILNEMYNVGHWSLNGTLTRYGSFVSYNSTTASLDQTFGAKCLLDLAVSYNVDRWTFTVGGDNVFNTYPDRVIAANDNGGSLPYSVFSPFGFDGAYVYGKVAYRW